MEYKKAKEIEEKVLRRWKLAVMSMSWFVLPIKFSWPSPIILCRCTWNSSAASNAEITFHIKAEDVEGV